MNKLIVDNQLQQKNTTNMITVAEDSLLIFEQPTDPIYLLIANSLTLENRMPCSSHFIYF